MNLKEQQKQAKAFIERWENRGNERQDTQSFWLDLLQSVYGIENPSEYIKFEDTVMMDHTSFMDGYIDTTKVLIEQKGANKDLSKAIKQSDGSFLTPFQQAKRYSANLPYSKQPRWIITCNFKEFYVYDMEKPHGEPTVIRLEDLEREAYRLEFIVGTSNEHLEREMAISMEAGEIVREIYSGLLKQYKNPDNPESLHAMNQLIVRLVFCFYAEDAGMFGKKTMFHDYLARFSSRDFRRGLLDLFNVLNTPIDERDPYLDDELSAFPYVNGGMFAENNLEVPQFTDELRESILEHASSSFDWSEISPTIFGAVFESTLNPETRRSGGMHYTSIENIHKVIDPLFLDALKEELNEIRQIKQPATLKNRAQQFQEKLSRLVFFDPACGSGNFLTETYLSLRRLENEAIKLYVGDTVLLDVGYDLVKVKISQLYGIEINDFAVSVANAALWIAESQMLEETMSIVYSNIDFLPIKSYSNIVEGNALRLNWEEIVPKEKLSYIIGNPPFVGHSIQNEQQKKEIRSIYVDENGKEYNLAGKIDYVAGWYFKAASLISNTNIKVAFVSTNSICQGEQVVGVWQPLYKRFGVNIAFAYQTFKWGSEAKDKAAVHCVIVGFSTTHNNEKKQLFSSTDKLDLVDNINPYLLSGETIFVESVKEPICQVSPMYFGSKPTDGGYFFLTPEEKQEIIKKEPQSGKYIRKVLGAQEYINDIERYCLWLEGITPSELKNSPMIYERVKKVREFRLASKAESTRKFAVRPTEFKQNAQPNTPYLIIPSVSSENRRYVPIGYIQPEVIATNATQIIPNATLYEFGVITSNVHMAWMRIVAGRLKSDYRYSSTIVYNTFPWPTVTEEQKEFIANTAQGILDARALYPDSSLADLYDELTMPVELRKAHQANDIAVMKAYGMIKKVDGKDTFLTESETVARLFEMYQELTEKK
ncbi:MULTISPECIES: DNA methyltransferase [unclassified Granulicatella]|uniref:DNA methyltransferase n=1 Tax=unclassified Granulicatella TaxID=2630493 RepID=UPI0025571F5B|nr:MULTISPECIES: DNA methyltransferase [unclassified Granulicatella]MDK8380617.1 methylase [Granulicatella sp. UMB5615B]MDK8523422.1 methylase [Granulicatella sp. UMB5615A]